MLSRQQTCDLGRPSCDRLNIAHSIDRLGGIHWRVCACAVATKILVSGTSTLWLPQRFGLYIYSPYDSAEGKRVSKIVN